ncbi:MAG: carboxyl transferase domain-containing protein [Pseudomonadota bacterium]
MGQWMTKFLKDLEKIRQENANGGGPERIEIQHEMGKLTIRERIACLLDSGSFRELGSFVRDVSPATVRGMVTPGSACDGVVMGLGKIAGREVGVYGTDYTVMAGSIGSQGAWKIADFISMIGKMQIPLIAMFDSAGERISIKDGGIGFDGFSRILRNHSLYSGIVPQIGLVLGPCTGLAAYAASLCNFLIMNGKTSFLWLGGERESMDGGTAYRNMVSAGQCDLIADDDQTALDYVKTLLSYIPQNCWDYPPFKETDDPHDRMEEGLLHVMPDDPRFTYDIHEIIDLVVDDGIFFELKEDFATNLVTGFARFGGRPAGIVANNPDELSGIMEPDSSDKYDRFMGFLDAFNIPLITFSDTTGFAPGDVWERKGVLRHGAKLLHTYSRLTIPKVTIQLRRSYGGGNLVMGSKGMGPDLLYGWPTTEFAPTGPETVLRIIFSKELAKAKKEGNYDEVHDRLLAILQDQFSALTCARFWTNLYTVNEIIDPRETRAVIIGALESLKNKVETLPENRRSIKPT